MHNLFEREYKKANQCNQENILSHLFNLCILSL